MSADEQKRASGEAAAALVEPGMVVGLNGEDPVAVTAALGRKGYYIVMLGNTGGMDMAVAAFSRTPK